MRASLPLRASESSGRWSVTAAAAPLPLGGSLARTPSCPQPPHPLPHQEGLPLLSQPELYLPLDWPPAHSGFGFDFMLGDWSEKGRKKLVEVVVGTWPRKPRG